MSRDPFQLIGTTLDGNVTVESVVGEGGFGVVYRGQHTAFGEPVAIKVLKLPASLDPSQRDVFLNKFQLEARILYKLSQNTLNVVRPIHFGSTETAVGWAPYCVMEWLEGNSLEDAQRARAQAIAAGQIRPGRSVGEIAPLIDPLVKALDAAHAMGVVHRDIKPPNVFLAGQSVKLLDFGIAKIVDMSGDAAGSATFSSGTLLALTPEYAAPEQWDRAIGEIGPATDIFALALMVIELLGDRHPLADLSPSQRMFAACNPDKRPTPMGVGLQVPPAVEAAFAPAVAVQPQARPASASQWWASVVQAASGQAMPATRQNVALAQTLYQGGQAGVAPEEQVTGPHMPGPQGPPQGQPGAGYAMTGPAPHAMGGPTGPQQQGGWQQGGWHGGPAAATGPRTPMMGQPQPGYGYQTGPAAPGQVAYAPTHTPATGPRTGPGMPPTRVQPGGAGGGGGGKGKLLLFILLGVVLVGGAGTATVLLLMRDSGPCSKFEDVRACAKAIESPFRDENYAVSLPLAKDSCKRGNALGCNDLGMHYARGAGVKQDDARAHALYKEACDGGEGDGCFNLAFANDRGEVEGGSKAKADELYGQARAQYKKACEAGDAEACSSLGYLVAIGRGGKPDRDKARSLYKRACKAGSDAGCTRLGGLEYADREYASALPRFSKACKNGYQGACAWLATLYQQGQGVAKDQKKAAKLFEDACEKHDRSACASLGYAYLRGVGVDANKKTARELFAKACVTWEVSGCAALGLRYERGEGGDKDLEKARAAYALGCKEHDGVSCNNLGVLYAMGSGVGKDEDKAKKLYTKGCKLKVGTSCWQLGLRARKEGKHDEAKQLIAKACSLGHQRACADGGAAGGGDPGGRGASPGSGSGSPGGAGPPASSGSWLTSRVIGRDNGGVGMGYARVSRSGSGLRVYIRNRLGLSCRLELDGAGSPRAVRYCVPARASRFGRSLIRIPSYIGLRCSRSATHETCSGWYTMQAGWFNRRQRLVLMRKL
ncbi:MAG: SEL1-like repeat protein [Myxococcales bacterium]|nr:SEL1-like repeat protein [Myxococcales bacterium]